MKRKFDRKGCAMGVLGAAKAVASMNFRYIKSTMDLYLEAVKLYESVERYANDKDREFNRGNGLKQFASAEQVATILQKLKEVDVTEGEFIEWLEKDLDIRGLMGYDGRRVLDNLTEKMADSILSKWDKVMHKYHDWCKEEDDEDI